jgi:uncharacterized membrane protein YbhN (UPF0104 family)
MSLINLKANLKRLKHIYLWLALCFFLFIGWRHLSDFKSTAEYLQILSAEQITLCFSLAFLSYSFRSLRWLGYMRLTERIVSTQRHIIIYLSGFAFTASPGKAGELMRGTYLDDIGVPFRYTFFSFVSERSLDVIMVLLLGTYFLIDHLHIAFIFLSICMLLLPFSVVPVLKFILSSTQEKAWLEPIRIVYDLWKMTMVLKVQCLTLFAWSAQGGILYLMLLELGVEISIVMAVSIYCLSLLIGAASLIPSGVGVTEIGMIWLLTKVGVDNDIAIIASLITRMLTLWPAMAIGLLCAFYLKILSNRTYTSKRF